MGPFSLKDILIGNWNYKRCFKSLTTDCIEYSNYARCLRCKGNVPFSTQFNICPSQAHTLVPNCQAAVLGFNEAYCIACKSGHIVSAHNQCIYNI